MTELKPLRWLEFRKRGRSRQDCKTLKVDLLKIDGSFIRDVIDGPVDDATVRCFVEMARVVGVKMVAEFVHRPEPIENLFGVGARLARTHGLAAGDPEALDLRQHGARASR